MTKILKKKIERVCQYSFIIFIHDYYDGAYLLECRKIIASSLIIVPVILLLLLSRTFWNNFNVIYVIQMKIYHKMDISKHNAN